MKSLKNIPYKNRHHFMKCECGEYFDMRDLTDVFKHLHKLQASLPKKTYSHSVRVGEPIAYTKTKRKIDLN
jgi:hypothetical protein